jgi:ferredoxin--NADP+ reductase
MSHLTDYDTKRQYVARVKESRRFTPDDAEEIREIVLEIDDASFHCEVDQSFGVLIQHRGDFGHEQHHRLYSVADLPQKHNGHTLITMLVKRCSYVDEFNGESYDGISSHFLCERQPGDEITITGPFALPFKIPDDNRANLILIGMGTGIAPFRVFIKHIYRSEKGWSGKVRLFYGAKSGLELLYLNHKDGDLTQYYDEETFKAFHALSPRPHWEDPITLDSTIESHATEILEMLGSSNTYLYVAGYEKVMENLDRAFAAIMGSREKWSLRKAELMAGNKWAEIIY